jgi:hypothetical protein
MQLEKLRFAGDDISRKHLIYLLPAPSLLEMEMVMLDLVLDAVKKLFLHVKKHTDKQKSIS